MNSSIIHKSCWVLLGLFVFTILKGYSAPTAEEYGTVLNLSGKQRMLSQKMSKEILLIALEVEGSENLSNLEKTSQLFDQTLDGLRDGDASLALPVTTSKRILRQLDKVESIWNQYYPIVGEILKTGTVSQEQIDSVSSMNLPLLKEMNRCVKLYEMDASKAGLKSDPGLAVSINLAGKQRMLTQKMSKEFLFICLGHDIESNRLSLVETSTLFDRTLTGLIEGDETLGLTKTESTEILAQLDVVRSGWSTFRPIVEKAISLDDVSVDDIGILAHENLPLLKEMNKAVGMYEREAAN